MDKIGILTFHRSENYGSVLQAWALCQQINTLPGRQAELIDYSNRAQQDLYALFLPPKSVKNIAKNLRACLLLPYLLRRKAAFRDFIGALPKSAPMQTEADFAAHRADYRAVVCGSDQIWNPGSLDFSTHFFAPDFAAQKISYAPSLRSATAAAFANIDLKGLLADFAAVSVREQESVAVIEQLTGRTPKVVLDPTLLPAEQDFAPILGTAPKGDYLFFYSIDYPPEVCRTVQQTARRLHLPVYILFTGNKTYRALPYGFRLARHQTPGDFLALVKGAKLVLSTSFHGTVFALRFGTPLLCPEGQAGRRLLHRPPHCHLAANSRCGRALPAL